MLTGVHKECLGDYLFDLEKKKFRSILADSRSFRMMSFWISVEIGAEYSKWPNFDLKTFTECHRLPLRLLLDINGY